MRETLHMDCLQYACVDLILCGRPVNSWHVRCWCGLRVVENAKEGSPYLEKNNALKYDPIINFIVNLPINPVSPLSSLSYFVTHIF